MSSKIPKKYLEGLSEKQQKKKIENIQKTKNLLKEGKKEEAILLSKKRPVTKEGYKKSEWIVKLKKKYGENIKIPSEELALKTGLPLKAQKEIIRKGEGAFLSSGSRATVSSPTQWGIARLASVIMNGPSRKLDKHILDKYNVKFK